MNPKTAHEKVIITTHLVLSVNGDPTGNRTRINGLKSRRPNR